MTLLGNLIWFIFGGWLVGTLYLIGALILFPLLPFLKPMISYAYWPFGRKPISLKKINVYKKINNLPLEINKFSNASKTIKILANVVWILTFGWILAVTHIVAGITNLILSIFIITAPLTIPNALANFKLIPVAFKPFGIRLIPITLANEIDTAHAKNKL